MEITNSMDAIDVIREWLLENGYDGLYNEDSQCGCWAATVSDFNCCAGSMFECKPGYEIKCDIHCKKNNPRPCIGPKDASCPECRHA